MTNAAGLHHRIKPGMDGGAGEDSLDPKIKNNGTNVSSTLSHDDMKAARQEERERRQGIVLWRKPIVTITYFLLESWQLVKQERRNMVKHRKTCSSLLLVAGLVALAYMCEGPHQSYINVFKSDILWCGYWIGLGILSSVGLGTGLHTFLLYLGPHIAKVFDRNHLSHSN